MEVNYIQSLFIFSGDCLTYHNGMMFTTKDKDNDIFTQNCAQVYIGAWWYKACRICNLNGRYSSYFKWNQHQLQSTKMMIKRN